MYAKTICTTNTPTIRKRLLEKCWDARRHLAYRRESVDGQDVRAVNSAAKRFVEHARQGQGPGFLLCNTYRYRGHHVGDINREYYRAKQEEQNWSSERDPIKLLGLWLIGQKLTDAAVLESIASEIKAQMQAAVEFAIAAPYPEINEVDQDVYA